MKNVVSMAILAIALGSCSKEPVDLSNNSGQNSLSSGMVGVDAPGPIRPNKRRYYGKKDGKWGCFVGDGSCHPFDIPVNGINSIAFKSVFDAIATKDPIVIQYAFSRQKSVLSGDLDEQVIDLAINGQYLVSMNEEIANKTKFLIFASASDGQIQMIYPIVSQ